MKAIATIRDSSGNFPEVGMTNRTVIKLKTGQGIINRVEKTIAKQGQDYKIELFQDDKFYGMPYKTIYRYGGRKYM